ncbi:MAG: S41 family peptidase [Bacteroidota bacterium]
MTKFIFPIFSLMLLFAGLSACEKAFIQNPDQNPEAIFQEAWDYVDRYYSYFDFKGVDWDSVYTAYEPRISDDMSDEALFEVIAEMLQILRDGHVSLESFFDDNTYRGWYLDYPQNFDFNVLERTYTNGEYELAGPFLIYEFDDIGYVRYSRFSNGFSNANLNVVIDRFQDKKGVIFDVRDNGGGSLDNAVRLAARFTQERTLVGQTRRKDGPGRDDFTPWEERYISPASPSYGGPVVVLTNRSCYSATNYFIQYMRSLDQITIVGDTSGGGAGIPNYTELANGWILRVSASQYQDNDGVELEGGIPPDFKVDISEEDKDQDLDTILEFALDLF